MGSIRASNCELTFSVQRTDHEPIANTALKTKVNKDRSLSENIHIQASISAELAANLLVPATIGTSEAKVQSRLLSSKTLATEVAVVVEDLKAIIKPEQKSGLRIEVEGGEDRLVDIPDHQKVTSAGYVQVEDKCDEVEARKDIVTSPGEDGDEAGWESGTVGGEQEAEDSWESGSLNDEVVREETSAITIESDSDGDDSDDDNEASPKPRSTVAKATSKLAGVTSTFLPSLSVGFTRGESDGSDWSDDDGKTTERKNRRGQRARRAIWEKKFGKNANHKKVEQQAAKASNHRPRSDANGPRNRHAVNMVKPIVDHRKDHPQNRQAADTGWGQRTGTSAFSQTATPAQRENKEKLHPSWEAKRKLKEKQNAGILPPQGTKIKF